MLALLFATLTAHAAPTTPAPAPAAPSHLKVLVLDVISTDLTPSEKVTLANLEAAHLGDDGRLDVLSSQDVKQLVTLQGQASEIGVDGKCTDACMAEVAGAIGAGVVVSTQAGKLGDTLVVTVAVFDAAKARSVARKSITAASLGELPAKMAPALDDLVRPLLPESVRLASVQPAPSTERTSSSPPPPPAPPPTTSAPTPAVQTRMVSHDAAPAPTPPPQEQPAEPPPQTSTSSDDDTVWVILGVGVAVGLVVVVALVATDGDPGKLFQ